MAGSTFMQIPSDVTDPRSLRRFLDKLVQQLDVAFGNRGDGAFTTEQNFLEGVATIDDVLAAVNAEALKYSKLDGSREYTDLVSYNFSPTFSSNNQIVTKQYVDNSVNAKIDKDGSENFTGIVSYDSDKTFTDDKELVAKKYVDDNFTNNTQQATIADLSQTISDPPTQAEVQTISDKVDAILSALRGADVIAP